MGFAILPFFRPTVFKCSHLPGPAFGARGTKMNQTWAVSSGDFGLVGERCVCRDEDKCREEGS